MSELFDEVDEEVRREQLKKLWDQYSLYIVAAAFLIIAAVGGWRGYQYLEAQKAAQAGDAFNKATELSEQNKHTEAEAATLAKSEFLVPSTDWSAKDVGPVEDIHVTLGDYGRTLELELPHLMDLRRGIY